MKMKCAISVLLVALLLPGLVMAQSATRATFRVTKDFVNITNPTEVTVTIDCNTGLILDQDKQISETGFVEFVVTDFTTTVNCSITEEVPAGYSDNYVANCAEGATCGGIYGGSGVSCNYTDVTPDSAFTCLVQNSMNDVDIDVTKEWVVSGSETSVDMEYSLRLTCGTQGAGFEYVDSRYDGGTGPGTGYHTFTVTPGYPQSTCTVEERNLDSYVEIDNGCASFTVSPGQGAVCTITNTVFFEGIPTLSQYGMAIMALLMLGVGFVGFRRFV